MHVQQWLWRPGDAWPPRQDAVSSADLVLAFGSTDVMSDPDRYEAVRALYPNAHIVGCSTGGEILGAFVEEGTLAVTAITFAHTAVTLVQAPVTKEGTNPGGALGRALRQAAPDPLAHVLVLADGLRVDGDPFVRDLEAELPEGVRVTGGLAADGDRFERTPLWADGLFEGPGSLAVGLSGERLRVGCGALGGWNAFGPDRLITRAEGKVLYTLDDRPALDLYKHYLGPFADRLPASGLLFPLAIRTADGTHEIARSALNIDEEAGSITFAGELPEGSYARFMRTNPERIIDGAIRAYREAGDDLGVAPELALLVSCIGRKQVLGQRVEEEVESAADVFGAEVPLAGFYSYGEFAPAGRRTVCSLHNQTMTVTTLAEV